MSDQSSNFPFGTFGQEEGLDVAAIFGGGAPASDVNPFETPVAQQAESSTPESQPQVTENAAQPPQTAPALQAAPAAVSEPQTPQTAPASAPAQTVVHAAPPAEMDNPIAAAFTQKAAENTQKGLLEKPPVFFHKNVKEPIEDASMTFEELRIRKSEDFTDLEEGKYVSWSVDDCGIRRDIKAPQGDHDHLREGDHRAVPGVLGRPKEVQGQEPGLLGEAQGGHENQGHRRQL